MGYLTLLESDNINPWRATYEFRPCIAWSLVGSYLAVSTMGNELGVAGKMALLMVCLLMACWWGMKGYLHITKKLHLLGSPVEVWSSEKLFKLIKRKKGIWLGWGFEWTNDCSQKLYDLTKIGPEKFALGAVGRLIVRILLGIRTPKKDAIGRHWIQGINREDEDNFEISMSQWVGNTAVMGVPGSGKTFMMVMLAHQFAFRGEPLIIFDPKDDADLRAMTKKIASMTSRPYYSFRLTDPKNSVRINPIGNVSSAQDVANRLGSLVPSTSASDPFKAQAWLTLSALSQAIRFLCKVPTIAQIKEYLDLGWDHLFIEVFKKHLIHVGLDAQRIERELDDARDDEARIELLTSLYMGIEPSKRSDICSSLIDQLKNPESWHLKMIAGLKPVLQQLTAGEVGALLSPDPDADDERLIIDAEQVIREGGILYIGLNTMSDRFASSAIASIFLADYSAVAGRFYASETDTSDRVVHMLLDECSELVDVGPTGAQGLLQLLNKGRGAGYRLVLFSQNLSDFTAGLGSKDKTYQIFGNINNKVALRCVDPETQEFFVKQFGKAIIKRGSYGMNTGSAGNDGDVTNFSGGYRQGVTEADGERMTPELLGSLPNFEYMGVFGGSYLVKGRFPLVAPEVQ
ncbi:MAG: hypothetical protein C9356_15670 [Oleiphilus sp.]|nr:MAG: hypothetical protein C9356_15670 [Oleiphilus sp.]